MLSVEQRIADVLDGHGIDLVLTVPCKYFAELIVTLDSDDRFDVLYPTREEEAVGIAAGAYMAGRKPLLLIQNSGLGNLVNAYMSLNSYYGIPLTILASHRGDELEAVPAQGPMGSVSVELLDLMDIDSIELQKPDDLGMLDKALAESIAQVRSLAVLGKKTLWTIN